MHKVTITPHWTISNAKGEQLSHRLLELLADVQKHGSLSASCKRSGSSYRHAWNLIRSAEEQIKIPLLNMERGKGSTLTPFAEKLVWAGKRIFARLAPTLESLASELEGEISKVLAGNEDILKVHASHGFAVEKLIDTLIKNGNNVERRYVGSQESVASLFAGNCELAGFHIPQGEFKEIAIQHYAKWLKPWSSRILHIATRRQGLMVAKGNPHGIYGISDLTKPSLRYVNRHPSSGTYFLLECFLKKAGIQSAQINGFNQSEFTHAAVAAYVASGMADVGLGVETPSRRFGLDFVPLATEQYFLVCDKESLETPHLKAVLSVLQDPEFQKSVNDLPGYRAEKCGVVETLQEAFPNSFTEV
jgi:molybdate transport repressor ModE-like protein